MGRYIDPNKPYSEEDKEFLRSRGRGYAIVENERRFGVDGEGVPEDHEAEGLPPANEQFSHNSRGEATVDLGGAPIVLGPDTGRVAVRENGVYGEGEEVPEEDTIDDDIVADVEGMKVADLKAKLDEMGVEYDKAALKEDLQNELANALQDERDKEAEK